MSVGEKANQGPPPGSVENANLVSFLGTTRTLTKVWVFVGGLVGLISVLGILFSLLTFRFPGPSVGGLIYAAIWVGVDLLILERAKSWSDHLAAGRYQVLKEPWLFWGILGLIFGVLPGVLLLVAYVRVLPWGDSLGGTSGGVPATGPAYPTPPPPPYAPPHAPVAPSEPSKT